MSFRIGFGFDVHRLETNLPFTLGGVVIPSEKGMVAHSDGDVLIHAICDALLGAVNLGDIGKHFPDYSDEFKNISSIILLQKTMELIRQKGYRISNIDSTVVVEKPKLAAYIQKMQNTIAASISISEDQISIKATTNEKLGFIGKEEGIAAYVVVLLEK
ncbi:MAG TPA: 2-C-methyl-D-erythritol 2,4-cyclodiphosphate synthase [Bacteroidales bacterium]|jgi:2-C-methyl-D-erythritol 2,4-cyclodiphosphate synthase|nr:2-C-methyl-D-erythritol 2,4-cyclodiphosphate synthase [Bacteroidales bacterium]